MNYLLAIPYKQELAAFVFILMSLQFLEYLSGRENRVGDSAGFRQLIMIVMAVYFTGVFHFTLLHRDVSAGMQYELSLFWSYRYVVEYNSMEFLKEVWYNVILLLPMGMLMPLYRKPFQKLRYTLIAGLCTSCFIELAQLIFHLGLFELDDIFNNTLGAYMGYSVYYCAACVWGKNKNQYWYFKLIVLLLVDASVIGCFFSLWKAIK